MRFILVNSHVERNFDVDWLFLKMFTQDEILVKSSLKVSTFDSFIKVPRQSLFTIWPRSLLSSERILVTCLGGEQCLTVNVELVKRVC